MRAILILSLLIFVCGCGKKPPGEQVQPAITPATEAPSSGGGYTGGGYSGGGYPGGGYTGGGYSGGGQINPLDPTSLPLPTPPLTVPDTSGFKVEPNLDFSRQAIDASKKN